MDNFVKYPRTFHLPFSPGKLGDDKAISDELMEEWFSGKDVVVTEKMDGECLSGETLIQTNLGQKRLDDICENKYPDITILCFDEDSNSIEYKRILNYFIKSNNSDWYEIELENGQSLILTGNHQVWLPALSCYRKVEDLRGDEEFLLTEKEDIDQTSQ